MHALARCLTAIAIMLALPAWSQVWPAKPIRMIVNAAAGAGPDAVARVYAPRLADALGQPVVIENRQGAAGSGSIGIEAVAKSAPDGYTLLNAPGSTIVLGPNLYKYGVEVARDLEPVAPTVRAGAFLVVRSTLPVHSVAELITYARANPGKLNFGTPGSGTAPHIGAVMLLRAANIEATHVPYKGVVQVLNDLLGDRLEFTFDPGIAVPHIKAGKLRLLAVVDSVRSPIFPDTPTMAEAGTEVNAAIVSGVFAPVGTPREIVARLNREIGRILQTAEVRNSLAALGNEVVTASPEEFAAMMHRDRERFGVIVREAGIRVD